MPEALCGVLCLVSWPYTLLLYFELEGLRFSILGLWDYNPNDEESSGPEDGARGDA